ncbi:MAG: hypothetical protein IJY04_08865, partial [Clostridia bacterium]|nr:hypothetical protein [Clostridia bacterium]
YSINVVVTPASEGALVGGMVITYSYSGFDDEWNWVTVDVTEAMTYAYADGAINVESVSVIGQEESLGLTFGINDMYELTVSVAGYDDVAMEYIPPVTLNADVLNGSYNVTMPMLGDTVLYALTFTPESEGAQNGVLNVVDNNNTGYSGDYDYVYVPGGEITITVAGSGDAAPFTIGVGSATTLIWNGVTNFSVDKVVEVVIEGSGTSADPYIITADTEMDITATYMGVWYTVTAPADGNVVVYFSGSGAELLGEGFAPLNNPYSVAVSAGDTVVFGVAYEMGGSEVDVTVTIDVPEAADLDPSVISEGCAWISENNPNTGFPMYILDFGMGEFTDNVSSAYPSFTYEISGNEIIISWSNPYSGDLADATFVYDSASDTIIATLGDGETVEFSRDEF